MTMHLAHPSLSMGGKRKGKVKFRNADEARKARELAQDWESLKNKWGVDQAKKPRANVMREVTLCYKLSAPPGRTTSNHIRSLDTNVTGPVSTKQIPQYTGTKMIGIGTLHKSNAVPVFSDDEAKDMARMRRG